MPRRKTIEEFKNEVSKITENEFSVVGNEYVNNRTKIEFIHNKCGTKFKTIPKDFISGKSRCPKCGYEKLKSIHVKDYDSFINCFNKRSNGEYEFVGEYVNMQVKISVLHKMCNKTFNVTPQNFINNKSGCPFCCIRNKKRTTEEFKREVELEEDGEYEVLGKYINKNTKIEFLHNVCGKTFLMSPDKFMQGHRCTACQESKGESRIRKALIKYGFDFSTQYRFSDCRGIKYPLPFDFAVFKNRKLIFLIEYDGRQHFEAVNFCGISDERAKILFEDTKNRDSIKDKYCKKHKIKLLRIPYTEYENIDKIISSMAMPSEA